MADKSRITELQTALKTKAADLEGMSTDWKVEDGGHIVITDAQHSAYLATVAEAKSIQALLTAAKGAGEVTDYLNGSDGTPFAARDAATATAAQMATKSLGEQFLDSATFADMRASEFRNLGGSVAMEGKDVFSAMGGNVSIPALGSAQQLPWQNRTLRPGRVRDLFPHETTTAAVLYGIRETGFTNNAAFVAERRAANGTSAPVGDATDVYGLKPKSNVSIETITYPISTLAHLMDVHKNVLADEPRLRGMLDRDMVDGVKMVEDEAILYGNGTGENLRGIINTTGVQTYLQVSPDKKSAAIRRAATRAMLAYFQPTGIVLHPYDWEDIELEEDGHGAYRIAVSVTTGAETRLWRMSVVETPAILQDKFLLGSFGQGARIYDREQVSVTVSTENRDNYERNVVTLRCEERLGLEVPRPESFVYGTFI